MKNNDPYAYRNQLLAQENKWDEDDAFDSLSRLNTARRTGEDTKCTILKDLRKAGFRA